MLSKTYIDIVSFVGYPVYSNLKLYSVLILVTSGLICHYSSSIIYSYLFSPSSKNNKIHSQKIPNIFGEWNFLDLIFSQKEAFLKFPKTENKKKFIIFQDTERSYISGHRNPKKLFVSEKKEPTLKKFLIFWKIELSYI